MTTAAAVAWLFTAFGGILLASTWVASGKEGGVVGPDVQETPADAHLSPALVYMHGLGAAVTVAMVIAAAVKMA